MGALPNFAMKDIFDALSLDASDEVIGLLAFALPIFVLLLLIVLLVRARRKARQRRAATLALDAGGAAALQGEGGAGAPAEPVATKTIETLEAELRAAMQSQSKTALAPIYLELARRYFASGDERACLESLRSAAGLAALHGPLAVHAEVRLELAEAALRAGDTTGACEQWQMARIAFEKDGQREAQDRVDRRMQALGCPTDWVLTDF